MKALVTGGAGFIGSNLVRTLLRKGHSVAILDNFDSGCRENLPGHPEVPVFEGDIRDAALVTRAIKGADVVFHLAASVGNKRSIEHPLDDSQINVIGTLNILEAARHNNVRKIVYSSSAGIFGELKTLPIREDHPVEPDTPYGASKLGGEKLCLAYAKLYKLEAVCLRYFNVFGVGQRYDAYGNVIPIFAFRMLKGEPVIIYGDGEQTRDFINVDDVAEANCRAAAAVGVSGAFNLGSSQRISINRLVRMMEDASGIKAKVQHAVPRKGDVRDSLADISAARRALGFEPTVNLQEGLRLYMIWAKTQF